MVNNRRLAASRYFLWGAWGLLPVKVWSVLLKPVRDPDLFWHLAAGREMLEKHRFLWTDVFSQPFYGQSWINTEWLFEVAVFLLEKYLGWEGLYWAKIFFSISVLAALVWSIRTAGARQGRLFFLSVAGFLVLQQRLFERAELFTFLFLGVELILILRARQHPARSFPWIMAGIVALWVNIHSGVVYGVGLLALLNVGARWSGEEPSFIKVMNQALLLAGFALLLNPYGGRLLLFYWDVFGQIQGELHNLILEWARPTLRSAPYYWVLFLASGVIIVDGMLREKKTMGFWIPAAVIFSIWSSNHLRSTALLPFVVLPMAAGWKKTTSRAPSPVIEGLFIFGGVLLICFSPLKIKRPPSEVDWYRFPVGACSFIQESGLEGKMYNTHHFGGYIQWKMGPTQKTFMDGRYLSYSLAIQDTNVFDDLLASGGAQAWLRRLKTFGFDFAVTDYMESLWKVVEARSQTPEIPYFDRLFPVEDWALVFWDDAALVFVRRTPQWLSLIQRHEYRALKPYRMDRFRSPLAHKMDFSEVLRKDLARHRSDVNFSVVRQKIEALLVSPPEEQKPLTF